MDPICALALRETHCWHPSAPHSAQSHCIPHAPAKEDGHRLRLDEIQVADTATTHFAPDHQGRLTGRRSNNPRIGRYPISAVGSKVPKALHLEHYLRRCRGQLFSLVYDCRESNGSSHKSLD